MSLLDNVKGMMTDALVSKISNMIGIDNKIATSAIRMIVPAVIGGLINKGSSESGAGGLLDLFKNKGFGQGQTDNLEDLVADKSKADSWMETGGDLLGVLFGNQKEGIMEKVFGSAGINKAGGSMLMKFLAPIVVNKLAGMVFKNGWGAKKLSSYLGEQKSSIAGLVPGLSGMMGFAEAKDQGAKVIDSAKSFAKNDEPSGGGGWWKWLLPLLIGMGIIWYLTKDGCTAKTDNVDNTEMNVDDDSTTITGGPVANTSESSADENVSTSETTMDMTSKGAFNLSEAKFNDDGNIVDANGKVLMANGDYALDSQNNIVDMNGKILVRSQNVPESLLTRLKAYLGKYAGTKLSVDKDGNLVNSAGSVIFKKGDYVVKDGFYYDKEGNKLGRMWAQIVAAVTDAAEQTVDAMKSLFSDMVTGVAGAKTEYTLSDIRFKKEDNRIESFSKSEVEGLAAALKENSTGKIVVRAYTNDGDGDKANNKLSKTRAEVVHDMLVTLGVPKGQISFKGMGSGENKVEVSTRM